MILPHFQNFEHEFLLFKESFNIKQNIIFFENFPHILHFTCYDSILPLSALPPFSNVIISFVDQFEDLRNLENLENIKTIYHYSIPNTKLAYPEPFVAAPSLMHFDLWFIHILTYQYWLWFIFIFIIVFFFVMFVCTLRWCNMRIRPRRETRGVSRSKCGDLITATVPVSWAASIIITESTDAIDYYEGYGTTELVVGIRAYQWGWEYYYPKDVDLNYNLKHNYSSFIGNSLKYDSTTDITLKNNNLWKFYQNKTFDAVITPAHLLLLPIDNFKLLNFFNFTDLGANPLREPLAFKKIKLFSKTHRYNLFGSFSFTDDNLYRNLFDLSRSDLSFAQSLDFGIKRQSNLINNSTVFNNYITFFDLHSVSKWFNFYFKNEMQTPRAKNNFLDFIEMRSIKTRNVDELRLITLIILNYFEKEKTRLGHFLQHPSLLNIFGNDKNIKYPIFKVFDISPNSASFSNLDNINKILISNDINLFDKQTLMDSFFDFTKTRRNYYPFSPNKIILLSEKTIKNFLTISPNKTNLNFSTDLNPLNNFLKIGESGLGLNAPFFDNLTNIKWMNVSTKNKLLINKVYFDYPHSPIFSSNTECDSLDYDTFETSFDSSTPLLFQGKEELMPLFLTTTYWNFYWADSAIEWRTNNLLNWNALNKFFYLPLFDFYYDYDFKNWQDLSLLEDTYWESANSIYLFDEYLSLNKEFFKNFRIAEEEEWFFNFNKEEFYKPKILGKPIYKNKKITSHHYSNSFHLDDAIISPLLLTNHKFSLFPFLAYVPLDETYENFKFLNHVISENYKFFFLYLGNFFKPNSHVYIFDLFRLDFEDFKLSIDEKNYKNIEHDSKCDASFIKILPNSDRVFERMDSFKILNELFMKNLLNENHTLRYNNYLNLRAPTKNAIVTYNALQKVFRTRFDEGRSNAKLLDFSNSFSKISFISAPRSPFEKLLSKNKQKFFKVDFFKNNAFSSSNYLYDLETSLNYYYFDFPFLLAYKSDASRYLWFDWFAKWGFYEIQPSSSAKYAIHGMPYSNKMFEFSTQINEVLNETETYLTRIENARRNYLSLWTHSPYLYARASIWFQKNPLNDVLISNFDSILKLKNFFFFLNWYWSPQIKFLKPNLPFFPSHFGARSYARPITDAGSPLQFYYYTSNTLIDILTRREYLYRQLFFINNKLAILPPILTNSPKNPLLTEIKSTFLFIDPFTRSNEYSRDAFYHSLNSFQINILKKKLEFFFNSFNFNRLFDHLLCYYFNNKKSGDFFQNYSPLKNQFRPLKKGISNMIRLHATGAIALPIEVRLQILASSKDVIHSWAVPSAGIKIDCVPGFSSHKVTIFLVSGIFWGQCMEICGRYHHWMPIIVYFMKRDLFFLWCTHFVFLSGSNNLWDINDRNYIDYTKPITFDKTSWITELNL